VSSKASISVSFRKCSIASLPSADDRLLPTVGATRFERQRNRFLLARDRLPVNRACIGTMIALLEVKRAIIFV